MALLLASATADAMQSRLPRQSVAAPAALGTSALIGSLQKVDRPVGRGRPASPSVSDGFIVPSVEFRNFLSQRCGSDCLQIMLL